MQKHSFTSFFLGIVVISLVLIFSPNLVFAVVPTLGTTSTSSISPGDASSNTLTISNFASGSQTNRLIVVAIAISEQDAGQKPTVTSIKYGPAGTSCTATNQSFSQVSSSTSSITDKVRNEVWYLLSPNASQTCNIVITLSANAGTVGLDGVGTSAGAILFSNVDQTSPFETSKTTVTTDTTGTSSTPSSTVINTTDHYLVDIVSYAVSTTTLPTAGSGQTAVFRTAYDTTADGLGAGMSYQAGGVDSTMNWTMPSAGVWAQSVVVVRSTTAPALTSSSTGHRPSGCTGDCIPPTLGINEHGRRLLYNGFTYNEYSTDVELYNTSIPSFTISAGQTDSAKFKIYEDSGPQNFRHFELAFGLAKGEIIEDSKASIVWDRTFDGKETTTLIDPDQVFDKVSVTSEIKPCEDIGSDCTYLMIQHKFRTPLMFDILATNVWDSKGNAWQNYYNLKHISENSTSSTEPQSVTVTPSEKSTHIPSWIKSNAGWWADGQIDDSSFIQGIQYLMKEKIMNIPPTSQGTLTGDNKIPSWIKSNAGWWADGQIDDSSFIQGIQWLITNGIVKISS